MDRLANKLLDKMQRLIVSVAKLNKRNGIPSNLPDPNGITGVVNKGFIFEGEEVAVTPNPTLGKWYKDRDDSFYWGGGLIAENIPVKINLSGLPINLPADYRLGIDISHHNYLPDWNVIKNAGVSFVYVKTTEGVGTPDPKAKENAEKANALDLRIGYYHFCRPDKRNGGTVVSDANAEATDVLNRFSKLPAYDLPLVLDLEDQQSWDTNLQPDEYLTWIETFLNKIKQNTGKDCAIYSRTEYLDRRLPANHNLKCKLWISYYPAHPDCKNVKCPKGWSDWVMWQYTEHGIIGNNSRIDFNILKDTSLF